MNEVFEVMLLLGLPASGKSEIRRFLANLDDETLTKEFHIGDTIHLDDFPYVYLMRKVDSILEKNGYARIFADAEELPFKDPRDWGTLTQLLNEDYFDLLSRKQINVPSYTKELFERIDNAGNKVGIPGRLSKIDFSVYTIVERELEEEASKLFTDKVKSYPDTLQGKTVIIEFARGGAQGSTLPLNPPFGYQYSLMQVANEILEKSVILYNWVTPEESRRKNMDRADPNNPGSILHHGVPMEVMLKEYGVDDIQWLVDHSPVKDTITIKKDSRTLHVPVAFFDNRNDKTTFLRQDTSLWDKERVEEITKALKSAFNKLYMLSKKD
ncbi:MAG: hypothetical protein ACP5SB_04135 [Caldisericaceae bacterium]